MHRHRRRSPFPTTSTRPAGCCARGSIFLPSFRFEHRSARHGSRLLPALLKSEVMGLTDCLNIDKIVNGQNCSWNTVPNAYARVIQNYRSVKKLWVHPFFSLLRERILILHTSLPCSDSTDPRWANGTLPVKFGGHLHWCLRDCSADVGQSRLYGKIRRARPDQIYVDERARSQAHSHKIIWGSRPWLLEPRGDWMLVCPLSQERSFMCRSFSIRSPSNQHFRMLARLSRQIHIRKRKNDVQTFSA
jgi:hypothetical protein